jgi:hypothetical protein
MATKKANAALQDSASPADIYAGIGSVSEIVALATLVTSTARKPANAHIHLPPNFSAFDTVEQAVQLAAEQGIKVLGANNYYDYSVYTQFGTLCSENGILALYGTEIICMIDSLRNAGVKLNDPGNPGKMYLCGKGISRFAPLSTEGASLLNTIRKNDSTRMAQMVKKLSECCAEAGLSVRLTEAGVKQMVVERHGCSPATVYLQERHVAQALQEAIEKEIAPEERTAALEKLFGTTPKSAPDDRAGIQNEIRSHLMKAGKKAFVPETFVDFDHARKLILALGGIPCYPILADGASPLCGYEENTQKLAAETRARGLHCTELIPVRNSPEQVLRYAKAMREAGFIVTAGTEHNTRDLIPLEPTCLNGAPIPEEAQAIFWEGACVVAAHQFLVMHERSGFVDGSGALAGKYSSPDARIKHLASVGAAVIEAATRSKV